MLKYEVNYTLQLIYIIQNISALFLSSHTLKLISTFQFSNELKMHCVSVKIFQKCDHGITFCITYKSLGPNKHNNRN